MHIPRLGRLLPSIIALMSEQAQVQAAHLLLDAVSIEQVVVKHAWLVPLVSRKCRMGPRIPRQATHERRNREYHTYMIHHQ